MTDSGDDPSFDIGAEDGSEDALSSVNGPSDAFGGSFYAGDAYLGTDAGFPIVIDGAVLQEELSIPVDEEFQAAAASSSSVAVGDVAFASGA